MLVIVLPTLVQSILIPLATRYKLMVLAISSQLVIKLRLLLVILSMVVLYSAQLVYTVVKQIL